jgi:hypothetical protein
MSALSDSFEIHAEKCKVNGAFHRKNYTTNKWYSSYSTFDTDMKDFNLVIKEIKNREILRVPV